MFKRMIVAMLTMAAMFCSVITVDAASIGSNGDGIDGRPETKLVGHDTPMTPTDDESNVTTGSTKPGGKVKEPAKRIEHRPLIKKDDQWIIYWYVCGTDIESQRTPGDVTSCIREIEAADWSSNKVQLLMMAGETSNWKHPSFVANNNKVGHYFYDNTHRNWTPLEPLTTMSNDPKTRMYTREALTDFLVYGKNIEQQIYRNPDKVHRIFIFVDHGGGSLEGVCYNESQTDYLDLTDIRAAFQEVWGNDPQNPAFDIVAFDTCLMSTYETAIALKGTANYMVASQESIFGRIMFNYTDLINDLFKNPKMSPAQFGQVICDTYKKEILSKKSPASNPALLMTLSVIDMNEMPNVEKAYENFGNALLEYSQQRFSNNRSALYSDLSGIAYSTERYPSDSVRKTRYPSMADLQNFALKVATSQRFSSSAKLQNASANLINAIDAAVIYNQRGDALSSGGGLSIFYPYDPNSKSNIEAYASRAQDKLAPLSQVNVYEYMSNMELSTTSSSNTKTDNKHKKSSSGDTNTAGGDTNTVNPSGPSEASGPQLWNEEFSKLGFNQLKPDLIDPNKHTFAVKLNQKQMDSISSVRSQILWFNPSKDKLQMVLLGGDPDVDADWKTGEFKSSFTGKWFVIQNSLVCVNLVSENVTVDANGNKSGTVLYSTPIKLKKASSPETERVCELMISYTYDNNTCNIIGAIPETNSSIPTGEIYGIDIGDVVTPIFPGMILTIETVKKQAEKYKDIDFDNFTLQEQKEFIFKILGESWKIELVDGYPFTVSSEVRIEKRYLPDAAYLYGFEFVNPFGGNNEYSFAGFFEMTGGEISDSMGIKEFNEKLETEVEKSLEK